MRGGKRSATGLSKNRQKKTACQQLGGETSQVARLMGGHAKPLRQELAWSGAEEGERHKIRQISVLVQSHTLNESTKNTWTLRDSPRAKRYFDSRQGPLLSYGGIIHSFFTRL